METLELVVAVITQLFLLPDHASHFKAIDHVLHAVIGNTNPEQDKEIAQVLHKLFNAYPKSQTSIHAREVVELLLQYIETDSESHVSAITALLDRTGLALAVSTDVMARLYHTRSWDSFDLNKKYALADFDYALQLNPNLANAYTGRGWCYFYQREFGQALADFDRALQLDPKDGAAYNGRGSTYMGLEKYEQALSDFDLFIKEGPKNSWAYIQYGRACTALKDYKKALASFVIDPVS